MQTKGILEFLKKHSVDVSTKLGKFKLASFFFFLLHDQKVEKRVTRVLGLELGLGLGLGLQVSPDYAC